jgi:hypothetical protein
MSYPRVNTMTFTGPLVRKEAAGFLKAGFCLQPAQATKVQAKGAICQSRSLAASLNNRAITKKIGRVLRKGRCAAHFPGSLRR